MTIAELMQDRSLTMQVQGSVITVDGHQFDGREAAYQVARRVREDIGPGADLVAACAALGKPLGDGQPYGAMVLALGLEPMPQETAQ